jgi:hypothetical protein
LETPSCFHRVLGVSLSKKNFSANIPKLCNIVFLIQGWHKEQHSVCKNIHKIKIKITKKPLIKKKSIIYFFLEKLVKKTNLQINAPIGNKKKRKSKSKVNAPKKLHKNNHVVKVILTCQENKPL